MHDNMTNSVDSSVNSAIPWSCDTNWLIDHGSLKDTVTVESLDCPVDESDPENSARKSPLILKPPVPDSGPCEIKICFEKKYEVGQIYVRSTARTFEIYYTNSPHSINEYLYTVRCSTAVRDDEVLQTNCIDNAEEHVEGPLEEVTAETASDGGHVVTGEDDWIKIKVPEVQGGSASDQISTNGSNKIQDFYEATAQISDSDPCMSLTIRLLSLQDKEHVYVDEIYMFVDPVESTDSGNEALKTGSSMQSSALMAMFMPTLMQLSKSGVNHVQEKRASEEVLKDGKMETESRIIDKMECHQQYVKPKELDKDTAESSELQQHTFAKKCDEPKNINDLSPGHVEIALEQLISRFSRVEDICLRFEEKMLKPIESIEARLQRVEDQLEKLAKNSQDFGLPRCTRISVPAFSCSESNSSSLYDDQMDYPPRGASRRKKKKSYCDNMPQLSHDANFHRSLVFSAPEFSCDEGDCNNDDLNPLEDSPCIKPKKTLSLDDALAASLNGFLSTAATNTSEHIETTLGLSTQVAEENQYQGRAESCHIKVQEFPSADNDNRESPRYAQVLTVKAPEFSAEETGSEEHLNNTQSSSDTASSTENVKDNSTETVPPSTQSNNVYASTESCDFNENKSTSTDDFASASNGNLPAVLVEECETCIYKGHFNGSSKVNMIVSYFEGDAVSAPDLAKKHDISDQDNASEQVSVLEYKNVSENLEQEVAFGGCLKDDTPNFSVSSHSSLLDFHFPILEVKFTSDAQASTKSSLEALLGGATESNAEARSINDTSNADSDTEQIDDVIMTSNETTDVLPINHPLVDVGVSAADGSSNLEGMSHIQCTPSSPEMNVSLI